MAVTYEDATSKTKLRSNQFITFLSKNASIVLIYGIIILIAGASAVFSDTFRTPSNMANILRQSIILGLLSIGQGLVILTGGMDISIDMIARVVALSIATLFAFFESDPAFIFPLILLGIIIGVVIGGINGLLITRTHANPFIITFGVAFILRGVNLAISTTPIRGVPKEFLTIYNTKIGIIAVNVIVMAFIWFLVWLFTTRTELGRAIYAVGGSPRIARLSAIRVNRTLVWVYVLSGFFAAIAGLFVLSRMGVGDPGTAEGMTFQSIVAVAVGGISLYGGRGSMIGTLGGVLLLTILANVFNLLQVNIYYQQLLLGLVVLIAVAAYRSPRTVRSG
ncbi:MAG: ABC transporter permease [Anaerolineales bacterium]|jgi:ribose transport system permease protein